MRRNRIGRTDVEVTALSFGCSGIGNLYRKIDDAMAQAVLQRAWDRGIRYFDTAPHYGRGLSEARLGYFLKGRNREAYAISTKVGRLLSPGPPLAEADGFIDPLPNAVRYDYTRDGIEAAFEQSCERLGTSHVDIVYVHDIGRLTHGQDHDRHLADFLGTGIEYLIRQKEANRIGAFGLGVNETEVCLEIMDQAEIDVILLAGRLTLLDRTAEERLVPLCRGREVSLVLGGIFNSGILATGPVAGAQFDYAPASEEVLMRVAKIQRRAEEVGIPLATAALHFALNHPLAASVLIGTAQISSLDRNLDAAAMTLPAGAEALIGATRSS